MSDDHKLPAVVERSEIQQARPNAVQLHPMVQTAMVMAEAGTMTPADLREYMAIQREHEAAEAAKAYTAAMVRLKAELPPIVRKDKKNAHHGWTYPSLEAMIEHVTEPLSAHGFALGIDDEGCRIRDDGDVEVSVEITHVQGHGKSMTLHAPPDYGANSRKTGKPTRSHTQAIMATITSLRRTEISMLLGLGSADMPDVDDATPPGDRIEPRRNLQVAAALKGYGKTREEAEAHLGRGAHAWTAGDISRLSAWARGIPLEEAEEQLGPATEWGPEQVRALDAWGEPQTTAKEKP